MGFTKLLLMKKKVDGQLKNPIIHVFSFAMVDILLVLKDISLVN